MLFLVFVYVKGFYKTCVVLILVKIELCHSNEELYLK